MAHGPGPRMAWRPSGCRQGTPRGGHGTLRLTAAASGPTGSRHASWRPYNNIQMMPQPASCLHHPWPLHTLAKAKLQPLPHQFMRWSLAWCLANVLMACTGLLSGSSLTALHQCMLRYGVHGRSRGGTRSWAGASSQAQWRQVAAHWGGTHGRCEKSAWSCAHKHRATPPVCARQSTHAPLGGGTSHWPWHTAPRACMLAQPCRPPGSRGH